MPYISARHEAAATLAQAGIAVFPCLINDKPPVGWLVPRGLKDRSCDPLLIDKWWSQGDWNVGVVPDDLGCAVIDLDVKDGKNGLETWGNICSDQGWEPVYKLVIRTPSGGFHLWFHGSLPGSVGTLRRGLGPGIDVRGRETYVLLPPSIVDGVEYSYA